MRKVFCLPWLPYAVLLMEIVWFVWFFMTEKDPTTGRPLRLILMDDGMISMGYARSLVQGCGLVWYCGADKVEGFTNPLWVFYMAFWHLFPISPNLMALPIILTGIGTLLIQLHYVKKIAQLYFSEEVGRLAQWVLVLLQPAWIWHIGGLETGALMALTVFLAYRALNRERVDVLMLFLIALGLLTRMDFLVPTVVIGAYISWRQRQFSSLMKVLVFSGIILGGLIMARWLYYGELVPNSYHLKVSSIPLFLRVANGLLALLGNLLLINLPLWTLMTVGLLRRNWQIPLALFSIGIVGAMSAYNVYVGGDAWETPLLANRYLALTYPFAAIWVGTILTEWRTLYQGIALALVATGISIRVPYFLLLHPDAHILTKQSLFNKYSVFAPHHLDELKVSREGTIWVVLAGTTPYFYPGYRYKDYYGKCSDKNILQEGLTCYVGHRFYLLYHPGHTKHGINLLLADSTTTALFWMIPPSLYPKPKSARPTGFCCEASALLPELEKRFEYQHPGIWLRKY